MKNFKLKMKWYFDQFLSQLSLYQIILFGLFLWLCGVWLWIIPTYESRLQSIHSQNVQMNALISENQSKPNEEESKRIIISEPINFSNLISILSQYDLVLEDYRELKTDTSKEYFIQVKGSWLQVRQYLNQLSKFYKDALYIQSIDLQRDEVTNQVSLSIRIQEP